MNSASGAGVSGKVTSEVVLGRMKFPTQRRGREGIAERETGKCMHMGFWAAPAGPGGSCVAGCQGERQERRADCEGLCGPL